MSNLKSALIRLGSQRTDLRPHLRPIVRHLEAQENTFGEIRSLLSGGLDNIMELRKLLTQVQREDPDLYQSRVKPYTRNRLEGLVNDLADRLLEGLIMDLWLLTREMYATWVNVQIKMMGLGETERVNLQHPSEMVRKIQREVNKDPVTSLPRTTDAWSFYIADLGTQGQSIWTDMFLESLGAKEIIELVVQQFLKSSPVFLSKRVLDLGLLAYIMKKDGLELLNARTNEIERGLPVEPNPQLQSLKMKHLGDTKEYIWQIFGLQ